MLTAPNAPETVHQIRALLAAGLPARVIRDILLCAHDPAPTLDSHPEMFTLLRTELDSLDSRITCLQETREILARYLSSTESGSTTA